MLKINNIEYRQGFEFTIRNSWKREIASQLGKKDFPCTFCIIDIDDKNKEVYYKCESIDKAKSVIMVSNTIMQYLTGLELGNCDNVGLYFKDYLPMENDKLLLINDKNKIFPCQLKFNIEIMNDIPTLSFVLSSLLDFSLSNITTYNKYSWKLLNESDYYMNDLEKMYQDTFVHKGYVLYVCNLFADYLAKQNRLEDAKDIRKRALVHDNSKILNEEEFRALSSIINDKSCLKDANARLSTYKQDAIELHWEHNEHHPEYWENINDMTPQARREFVCDCCARSLQYNTNLLEFMEQRLKDRFHFSPIIQEEILYDCKILVNLTTTNK